MSLSMVAPGKLMAPQPKSSVQYRRALKNKLLVDEDRPR
jgi:hypothetical protein